MTARRMTRSTEQSVQVAHYDYAPGAFVEVRRTKFGNHLVRALGRTLYACADFEEADREAKKEAISRFNTERLAAERIFSVAEWEERERELERQQAQESE